MTEGFARRGPPPPALRATSPKGEEQSGAHTRQRVTYRLQRIIRLARRIRDQFPDLAIIARARDTDHAARLYRAGVTDAVPEAMEASLQLSEAVLVDIGVAMGPVIASIHEKRSELRGEIMAAGELDVEPTLGRRRVRDSGPQR